MHSMFEYILIGRHIILIHQNHMKRERENKARKKYSYTYEEKAEILACHTMIYLLF